MSFEPLDSVRHILAEVAYLRGASANVDESTFLSDATLQRAFIRSLEVIGEATKRLPPEFRAAHPEVDWRGMVGMRDRLIHGYSGRWCVHGFRSPSVRWSRCQRACRGASRP